MSWACWMSVQTWALRQSGAPCLWLHRVITKSRVIQYNTWVTHFKWNLWHFTLLLTLSQTGLYLTLMPQTVQYKAVFSFEHLQRIRSNLIGFAQNLLYRCFIMGCCFEWLSNIHQLLILLILEKVTLNVNYPSCHWAKGRVWETATPTLPVYRDSDRTQSIPHAGMAKKVLDTINFFYWGKIEFNSYKWKVCWTWQWPLPASPKTYRIENRDH